MLKYMYFDSQIKLLLLLLLLLAMTVHPVQVLVHILLLHYCDLQSHNNCLPSQ